MTDQAHIKVLLESIKSLLSNKSAWTTGAYAKTSGGEECLPLHPLAVCWCLSGAVLKRTKNRQDRSLAFNAIDIALKPELSAARLFPRSYIVNFNDGATFEEVHAVLDRAIANQEATP